MARRNPRLWVRCPQCGQEHKVRDLPSSPHRRKYAYCGACGMTWHPQEWEAPADPAPEIDAPGEPKPAPAEIGVDPDREAAPDPRYERAMTREQWRRISRG